MTSGDATGGRGTRLLPWAGAALGFLWFLAVGGGRTLDPTNLEWAGGGDRAQHVLGWLHFRNAPWGFPLGQTPSLMYPLPTGVGFTDSNPWVAIALKPFSRWLPQDFQYVGPWLALCFALQGWVGVKLMELFTPRPAQRLSGAALFVLAPVLLARSAHDTLCAHWMILAMLYLSLRPRRDARDAWRALGGALALNVAAAGIHPYLEVMVFALSVALLFTVWRVERLVSGRSAAAALAAGTAVAGALFAGFGYLGQGVALRAHGLGYFSADTLSLVNPMGWSRLVPALPRGPGQYEGFGYLGTGVLLLGAALLWRPRDWLRDAAAQVRARWPLALTVLALAALALSTVVTVAGRPVLSVRGPMVYAAAGAIVVLLAWRWRATRKGRLLLIIAALGFATATLAAEGGQTGWSLLAVTAPLGEILHAFRSSGRFIWPLHYAALTGIVALVVWRSRRLPSVAASVLFAAVVVQALDTADLRSRGRFLGSPWPRLRAPEWERLDAAFRHIVLYPPLIVDARTPCAGVTFRRDSYVPFADLAYRRRMTTNSAYSARIDDASVRAACRSLVADVEKGRLAEDTVYVVDAPSRELFLRLAPRVTCGALDGFTVCVAAQGGSFREALRHDSSQAVVRPMS